MEEGLAGLRHGWLRRGVSPSRLAYAPHPEHHPSLPSPPPTCRAASGRVVRRKVDPDSVVEGDRQWPTGGDGDDDRDDARGGSSGSDGEGGVSGGEDGETAAVVAAVTSPHGAAAMVGTKRRRYFKSIHELDPSARRKRRAKFCR